MRVELAESDDWSDAVAPFWMEVIRTALTPEGLRGVLQAGKKTVLGAAVMPLMALGYRIGTIKFNIITAEKPL